MSEEELSDFQKAELKAKQQGKTILEVMLEQVVNEESSNQSNSTGWMNSTITLNNLLAIRNAMEEINIKERSEFFQQYYDELVHTIVELRKKEF